jgi:hypothetical protein
MKMKMKMKMEMEMEMEMEMSDEHWGISPRPSSKTCRHQITAGTSDHGRTDQ